ncbi:unnamed protein product [Bursaphelenchus xylophilus]|uniref:(pine wood nematode) hypothetical protein n=1 Tax=Bursaphelenchus xylophilus TaxID=6326 RepID=A0A1I7S6M1_BURXY|nr:unnamed protein product [Bursaphelenchus xylophilus]CAG9120565.1 unnamed protein product [Bursaphelenchus xylophilus]
MRKPLRTQYSTDSSTALLIRDSTPERHNAPSTSDERRGSGQPRSARSHSQCSVQSRPLVVTRYKSYITQASTDQSEFSLPTDISKDDELKEAESQDRIPTDHSPEDSGHNSTDELPKKDAAQQVSRQPSERKERRSSSTSKKAMTAAQKRQNFSRKSSTLTETLAKQLDFDLGFCSSTSSSDTEHNGEPADMFDVLYKRIKHRLKKDDRQQTNFEEYFYNPRGKIWSKKRCKEIFAGKRMRKMAFWFIVIFLAALTVKDVIELVAEYCENPKQSDINIRFNKTMKLPDITFCMRRMQTFSHFNLKNVSNWDEIVQRNLEEMPDRHSFLRRSWDYRLAAEGYQVISALSSIERETTAIGTLRSIQMFRTHRRLETKRRMIKMWMAELKKREVSFEEFTQKVGLEVFRHSNQSFLRTSYNEHEKFVTGLKTSWISEQEFCFQPKYELKKPITDQGYFFRFVTSHNPENLDDKKVDCMTVDFHGRPSSLTRYTQATAVNDGFIEDLCIGMRHEIVVDIKALYEMLENDDEGTECREMTEDSENEFDCRMRCRMEMIQHECHCTPATLSYLNKVEKFPICDYTKCIFNPNKRNITEELCTKKCRRSCVQVRYNVVHHMKGKSQKPDLTRVDLMWGSFEYLVMRQDWVWSVTSFIAALGGSIGMWLGLSILSLIQGGTYLYAYLTENVIKNKIAKTISTAKINLFKKEEQQDKTEPNRPSRSRIRRDKSTNLV